jgi:hypothetical protein
MAKPPEPIDEVLPAADSAVLATVTRVVEQSPQQPYERSLETSLPTTAARQVVELEVTQVLFGQLAAKGARVKVIKPEGAYALREGNKGPFVLGKTDGGIEILGRYGPDTWPEAAVKHAAASLGKH